MRRSSRFSDYMHPKSRFWRAASLAAFVALGAGQTAAQEAYAISCKTLRTCDARGACQAGGGDHRFHLEPVKVKRDGAGTYRLTVAGKTHEAEMVTEVGPLLWQSGRTDLQTVLFTSDTEVLWQQARYGNRLSSRLLFLSCEETR